MNSNLGPQLSKACESVVLVMDIVGHVLQILTSNSIALSRKGKFKSVQTTSTFSHLHMSLNQKSFQEDKVAMLCVLYIHHSPWILNRTTWDRKRKKINPFLNNLPPSYFSPSNVKNGAGSHLGRAKFSNGFLCAYICVRIYNMCAMPTRAKGRLCFNFSFCSLKSSSSSESQSGNW